MNDLQKKEFELLKYFIEVCRKLNLTYYLVCGSALGAVKYSGFIPWDDDVDVALPRRDYEIFCEKAQEMLPEWIFVQNYKTDPRFPKMFTKLRNSNTTYIEKDYRKLNINHGVFIDVFSLDGYPQDEYIVKKFERKKLKYLRQTSCVLDSQRSTKAQILCKVNRLLGYHRRTVKILSKYEAIILKYTTDDGKVYCNYGNFRGRMQILPKEIYGDGMEMTFEGIKVRVPQKYDEYLRGYYGNYEKDPPVEEQKGYHYYDIIDLRRSYIEYIKSNK